MDNMDNKITELTEIKERIDSSKQKVSELKANQNFLLKKLKDEWNCNTLEEAEKMVIDLKASISTMESDLNKKLDEIKFLFDNNG